MSPVIFILSIFLSILYDPARGNDESLRRLKEDLLKKSEKLAPDTLGKPILVSISFDHVKLISFQENDENFGPNAKFTIKMHQMWSSEAAKWDPNDYASIDNFVVNSQEIWTPDFLHISSMDGVPETLNVGPDDHVTVYSDGSLDRSLFARVRTTCRETTHEGGEIKGTVGVVCAMVYGSGKFRVEKLKFGIDRENNTTLEATVLNSGISTQSIQINEVQNFTDDFDGKNQFSRLILIVNLTKTAPRKLDSAFFQPIVLPCVVFSLLILLQFLVPPNIGERVVYGILVLIFMMLFFYFVTDFTSRTATMNEGFWTLPSVYVFCLILGAAAALTNTCLVVNFYHTKHNVVMDDKVKRLFLTLLPRALCMRDSADDVERKMFDKRQSTKRRRVSDSAAVESAYGQGSGGQAAAQPLLTGESTAAASSPLPPQPQPSRWSAAFLQMAWLREIARDLRDLSHSLNVRLAERRGSPQWMQAALVLNRFGFLTCAVYLALCHVVAVVVYWCA